jgi:hypothetical protein
LVIVNCLHPRSDPIDNRKGVPMPTIVIRRSDVTTDELADLLRRRLGPRYHVLPDTALNWNPVGDPRPGHPDTVVVGTGSNRLFRAQVKLTRGTGATRLDISPGGITPAPRVANRLGIARRVFRALDAAPTLR